MKLGKTIILGDSYSTFAGYIPQNFSTWYSSDEKAETDVTKVQQTWWYNLFDGTENILLANNSFSGSTICNTVRPEHTVDVSFVSRFDKMTADGFFLENAPDTIIIFGGTNDSWINVPIGSVKYGDITEKDLLCFLPACCYLASSIKNKLPNTKVIWLINTELNIRFSEGIIEIANHYGQKYIQYDTIDKNYGHPTIKGMQQIAQALK